MTLSQTSAPDSVIYNPWKLLSFKRFQSDRHSATASTNKFANSARYDTSHPTEDDRQSSYSREMVRPQPKRPFQKRKPTANAVSTPAKRRKEVDRPGIDNDAGGSRKDATEERLRGQNDNSRCVEVRDHQVRITPTRSSPRRTSSTQQPVALQQMNTGHAQNDRPDPSLTTSASRTTDHLSSPQRRLAVRQSIRPAHPGDIARRAPMNNASRDNLLQIIRASENRVLREMASLQRTILARVGDLEDAVKELPTTISTVQSSIADLKVMVLPNCDVNSLQRNSIRPRKATKAASLRKNVIAANPTLPAELKIVFDTDIVCVAAAKAIAVQMARFHRTREAVGITARAMHAFLYGLKKEMSKSALKDGVGYRHAEFRFKIAKIFLELAKTLPEHLFTVQDTAYTPDMHQDGSDTVNRKPSWLTSDLVNSNAMSLARLHHDCLMSELPKDPTSPDKRKSLLIAKSLMKVVIDMLRVSRDKSKVKMFEDGIYCLVDWEGLPWFPDGLINPNLSFLHPEAEAIAASALPETQVGGLDDARKANNDLLQNVISDRREMLVEAIYNVYVTKTVTINGRKARSVVERRTLRRVVSILLIAKSFLCSFCHLPEEDILRTHATMLQCLYRFALFLRTLFVSKISGAGSNNVEGVGTCTTVSVEAAETLEEAARGQQTERARSNRPPSQRGDDIPPSPVRSRTPRGTVHGPGGTREGIDPLTLEMVIPAESDRDRILQNIVKIPEETYDRINTPLDTGATERVRAEADNPASDIEGLNLESDSDADDNMSDMIGDDE